MSAPGQPPKQRRPRKPQYTDDGPYVDRFGLLLVVTVLSIVGLSLFDILGTGDDTTVNEIGALAASWVVAATLLIALRASGLAPRRQRVVDVLVGIGLVGVTIVTIAGMAGAVVIERYNPVGLVALLSIVVPVVVVRRLLRHDRVTSATLLGAIAAFLLIPVSYFHVFLAINEWGAGTPFFGQPQPSQSYMYFALVTVTTVGYGDLAAVTNVGRLAASSLAVVGQVYLVVFVAMIVGLRAQEWRRAGGGSFVPPPDRLLGSEDADRVDGAEHDDSDQS